MARIGFEIQRRVGIESHFACRCIDREATTRVVDQAVRQGVAKIWIKSAHNGRNTANVVVFRNKTTADQAQIIWRIRHIGDANRKRFLVRQTRGVGCNNSNRVAAHWRIRKPRRIDHRQGARDRIDRETTIAVVGQTVGNHFASIRVIRPEGRRNRLSQMQIQCAAGRHHDPVRRLCNIRNANRDGIFREQTISIDSAHPQRVLGIHFKVERRSTGRADHASRRVNRETPARAVHEHISQSIAGIDITRRHLANNHTRARPFSDCAAAQQGGRIWRFVEIAHLHIKGGIARDAALIDRTHGDLVRLHSFKIDRRAARHAHNAGRRVNCETAASIVDQAIGDAIARIGIDRAHLSHGNAGDAVFANITAPGKPWRRRALIDIGDRHPHTRGCLQPRAIAHNDLQVVERLTFEIDDGARRNTDLARGGVNLKPTLRIIQQAE